MTAIATAVVLGAGGITAYTLLSGSGVTLDARVPGDVAAFAEINFDPPAGQKVAAFRFFRHIPALKSKIREDSRDLIEGLIEPFIDTPADRQKFVDDIKPWLGKHAAFAAEPQGETTEPVVLIEATDTGRARTGLDALRRQQPAKFGYVISDRTVVIARNQSVAQAAVDGARSRSLHDNDTFRKDLKVVGEDSVLAAWFDLSRAASLPAVGVGGLGLPSTDRTRPAAKPDLHGRVVAGLHFSDTAADLVIRGVGVDQTGVGSEVVGPRLATLPGDTAAAMALSGADKAVTRIYDQAEKAGFGEQLTSLEEHTKLVLPGDIAALVGSSTVAAVGGSQGNVEYGVISRTNDVGKARSAAQRLLTALGEQGTIDVRPVADGTVIANSSSYADKLATSGTLGNSDLFRNALPELATAQFALYADAERLARLGGSTQTSGVRAFGLTASATADTATMHMRVVV